MPLSPSSAELEGRVVSGHGRHVVVEAADGTRILCHARGKKSETVVGDRVRWQRSGDEGVVEEVLARHSLLYRQDAWKTKAFAANLDQLLVVVAAEPVFSESQLARALISAEAAGIPSRIVLNKQDLPSWAAAAARLAPYETIGVEVVGVALK
jgi:ribosome biogenesis GTPase